jgi:hypothetical protein
LDYFPVHFPVRALYDERIKTCEVTMEILLAIAFAVIVCFGGGRDVERDYSTERYSATSNRTWGDKK